MDTTYQLHKGVWKGTCSVSSDPLAAKSVEFMGAGEKEMSKFGWCRPVAKESNWRWYKTDSSSISLDAKKNHIGYMFGVRDLLFRS